MNPGLVTTFRSRLTVALAASTAAFLSVFCLVVYLWCRSAFISDLDGDLEALFRADFAADGTPHQHVASGPETGEFNEFHVFKLLVDVEGRVLKSSSPELEMSPDLSPATLQQILEHGSTFSNLESGTNLYRILSSPVSSGKSTQIEIIGISQEPMQEALAELRQMLGLSLLAGILLVLILSNKVAGLLTRPLEGILGQLESVTRKGDPRLRLSGTYRDDEIARLKREVNAMLERLEQNLHSQHQFVSNASHELRAPLANLTLAIEVCLRRERSSEEYQEALKTCHGEAKRLNEMADQLLTLSSSDEGALVLQKEFTDLAELLRGCLARNAVAAQSKSIECVADPQPLVALVDPLKLGQVVDNLLGNAIRYSPNGSTVRLEARKSGELAEISVKDSGPGITQAEIERIFDRFYRVDPSRQRETGGAGLGLAISREIVEAHGGKLVVESTPGRGTTFLIRLYHEVHPAWTIPPSS